jgi:primase-polymerase (primpol)-like protein
VVDTNPIPVKLRERPRWILHKAKRPIAVGGWWTSVKDETTWMTYGEAREALARKDVEADGIGFVLNGDGVVCLDLDDCVEGGEPNVFARDFIRALEVDGPVYVEFSPSGKGLHVWGYTDMPKGKVVAGGNLKVEAYPNKRFITMTGKPYREGRLRRLHIHNALRLVA